MDDPTPLAASDLTSSSEGRPNVARTYPNDRGDQILTDDGSDIVTGPNYEWKIGWMSNQNQDLHFKFDKPEIFASKAPTVILRLSPGTHTYTLKSTTEPGEYEYDVRLGSKYGPVLGGLADEQKDAGRLEGTAMDKRRPRIIVPRTRGDLQ